MDKHRHFDNRAAVEDVEGLFGLADECDVGEGDEVARIWRLHTVGRGYQGVSTAMTLEGAREFAAALREEGVRVLRCESEQGEIVQEDGLFGTYAPQ